ncbi:MAG: SDR family NAD(P)-dependent oxidoreductase [Burkholderiaceae bacterium]|nr:SDR family NAD(P)-dependent oxidoreductase [Burkholderiaceae bacterium]
MRTSYAASKAFVLSFSEALWAEYYSRKIQVVALCPGAVETGFIDALGDESIRQTPIFSTTIFCLSSACKTGASMRAT